MIHGPALDRTTATNTTPRTISSRAGAAAGVRSRAGPWIMKTTRASMAPFHQSRSRRRCRPILNLPGGRTSKNIYLFYHNADHILRDEKNAERLREICTLPGEAPPSDEDIASKFEAALTYAERYAKLNPRRVLPQLYLAGGLGSGKGFSRQLLLPLHIMSKPMADAALAVNLVPDPDKKDEDGKTDWMYVGATLLTLDMALQNARVVNSIEVPWLCHAGQQLYEMQQAIDNLINENEDLRVAVQNTLQ